MATLVTRLTNTGNLLVNGSFDEVSLSSGSISLNGTSQYVTAPANSKFNLTGDFTVEGWYWIDSTTVESRPDNLKYVSVFSGHGATSGTGILEVVGNATVAGTGLAIYQDSPSIILSVSTTIPLDSWVHLAFVRTGTTIYGFVNGTRFTLGTSSASFISGTNPVAVGRHLNTSYDSYFKGYVTNVRVVKGTALYTANFIPSISILPAVANTSLLLNVTDSSNFIKDNSENKFTLTNFNSSTFNALSPFNTSNSSQKVSVDTVFSKQFDEVSIAAGSINFEGSEYILVNTTNNTGNIGTQDFTWEAWVYPINFSTDRVIFDGRDGGGQNSLNIRLLSSTGVFRLSLSGASITIDGSAVQANAWTHLAITRSGTLLNLFQNGVITNTVINSTSLLNYNNRPIIGASGFTLGNASFNGYISNLRLVKGDALYTTGFTPPQTVLDSTANTSLLFNVLNSTGFRKDNGPYNFVTTVSGTPTWSSFGPFNQNVTGLVERRLANVTIVKDQFDEFTGVPIVDSSLVLWLDAEQPSSYVGSGSNWVDLSRSSANVTLYNTPSFTRDLNGGKLSFVPASSHYGDTAANLGNLNRWTIEAWVRVTASLTNQVTSVITNVYNGSVLNFSMGTNNAPTNYNLCVGFFDGAWRNTTGFTPTLNTWYHVAGTYDGSTLTQYVNGVISGSAVSYSGTPTSGGVIRIARRWDDVVTSTNLFPGDIVDIRVYNRSLLADEVSQNFNALRRRFSI